LSEIVPHFSGFVQGFDLKNADWSKLCRLVNNAMAVLQRHPEAVSIFTILFEFAERLMRGDVLQRRLVGAQILSFGASHPFDVYGGGDAFGQWKRTTKIISVLIEGYLHPQLLEKIGDLLEQFMNGDYLKKFWEKTETAHSSQSPMMLSIITKALERLDSETASNFLRSIASRGDQLSSELIDLMCNSVKSLKKTNPALGIEMTDVLFSMASSGRFVENVQKGLSEVISWHREAAQAVISFSEWEKTRK
jgi:hypothetical protein